MGTTEQDGAALSLWLQNTLLVGETRAPPGVPLSSRVWLSLRKESVLGLLPTPVCLLAFLAEKVCDAA